MCVLTVMHQLIWEKKLYNGPVEEHSFKTLKILLLLLFLRRKLEGFLARGCSNWQCPEKKRKSWALSNRAQEHGSHLEVES